MAWPASQQGLSEAFQEVNRTALQMVQITTHLRDMSAAGPVRREMILDLQRRLDLAVTRWTSAAAKPGIAEYAQAQFGDAQMDVAGEFNGMVTAATNLRDWIHANFPRDVNTGAVLTQTVDQSGAVTELTFTTAQLAPFRTQADAFLATIG